MTLLDECLAALDVNDVDHATAVAFFVPGRIEVLGKHTDYAGGRSLLCALEHGICIVAVPRDDDMLTVMEARTRGRASLQLTPALEPGTGWARYAGTVARRVARDFPLGLRGANVAFTSDLPIAAGMSSSAALVIAVFLVLSAVNDLPATDEYRQNIDSDDALADYLSAVENGRAYRGFAGDGGVGTQGGSEDHTAILCARPGALVQYTFAPVHFERTVKLPAGYVFVLGSSGVLAEKAAGARAAYNDAAEQLRVAAELWRESTGRADDVLGAALLGDAAAVRRMRNILRTVRHPALEADVLRARVEQFVEESDDIIPAAGDALLHGDVAAFGRLVDRSHELAVTVLRNQIAETIHLAASARALGAVAASAFGAGFGGSVWALVPDRHAHTFLERWQQQYLKKYPQHAATSAFFVSRAAAPAVRLT